MQKNKLAAVLVVCLLAVGSAYALTVTALPAFKASMFSAQATNSQIVVDSYSLNIVNSTNIEVTLTLKNTDSGNSHSTAGGSQISINDNGNVLASEPIPITTLQFGGVTTIAKITLKSQNLLSLMSSINIIIIQGN